MCVFTHTHPESIQMLSCLHPFLTQGVKTSQAADLLAARMSAFLFLVFLGGLKGHQKHPFDLGFGAGQPTRKQATRFGFIHFFFPPANEGCYLGHWKCTFAGARCKQKRN